MRRRQSGVGDLFPDLIAAELREIDERMKKAAAKRAERFLASQRKLISMREAWADSEFALRIDGLINKLCGHGPAAEEMLAALVAGSVADLRAQRLTDSVMSFRESKASEMLAKLNASTDVCATYQGLDLEALKADEPDVGVLPHEILQRLHVVMTAMGQQLAGFGFCSEKDVRSDCPSAARTLAARMHQCVGAVILLAVARQQSNRPHKRWNPAKLARAEAHASEMLGIDTKIFQPPLV